jgi:hypothetical protein
MGFMRRARSISISCTTTIFISVFPSSLCLILGCIVIFSWFGVNQLGVGLHAYGFTDGTWPKIYAFWLCQIALLCYGLFIAWREGRVVKSKVTA